MEEPFSFLEKPSALVIKKRPIPDQAMYVVYNYVKTHLEKTDTHVSFSLDEVYVVWFSKTLQNWKALVSTTLPDGMYYEVTYNGDKQEVYLDAYKKFDNVAIPWVEQTRLKTSSDG
jgi:hypothetical protein